MDIRKGADVRTELSLTSEHELHNCDLLSEFSRLTRVTVEVDSHIILEFSSRHINFAVQWFFLESVDCVITAEGVCGWSVERLCVVAVRRGAAQSLALLLYSCYAKLSVQSWLLFGRRILTTNLPHSLPNLRFFEKRLLSMQFMIPPPVQFPPFPAHCIPKSRHPPIPCP